MMNMGLCCVWRGLCNQKFMNEWACITIFNHSWIVEVLIALPGVGVTPGNVVVTPLRTAASYEQRKANFSAPYYHVVPRITQHQRGYPRYRHIEDTTVEKVEFTWQNFQKPSRRPRKGPITTTYCHVDAVFATS